MTETPASTVPATKPQPASANGKPVADRELLRRFVRLGDEAAFAALVRRHSGLVIGVCRRVLRSEHDIEDAFQATFLVLARDAGRIRKTDSLASWLHGVAYRTSLRAADSTRRRSRLLRELTMIDDTLTPADDSGPLADVEQRHQQQALDEELASLPDNYRAALVLHYLDGKSNQQVAEELGLSVTAVEGRLKRGRKELRLRLARRGIGLSVAVAAMQAVQSSAQAAPLEPLIARAIDAGLSYAGGEAAGPVYSPEAARLAGQELMTMSTTTTATLAAVILLPLALGFAGHQPVAAVPSGSGAVNTVLAQIDVEADESESPNSGAIDLNIHQTEFGASAIDPESGGEFGFASGGDAVDEQEVGNVSDVRVTTVHKDEDGRTGVVVDFVRGGSRYRKILWVDDDEVETRELNAADQQAGEPALQENPGEQVISFEEKNGHVIIKYRKADGEIGERVVILDDETQPADARPAAGAGAEMPDNMIDMGEYANVPSSERNIAVKLTLVNNVEFVDTPLHEVIDFLATQNDLQIMIDETALEDVGIATDEPVNLVLQEIELQNVLNHILRPLGLTTIIRDEVLQVTTKELADDYVVTRVYDISDLAGIEEEQLLKVLEESLPDAYWMDTDGAGGTASILDDALVVKQSQSAHRQIVDLLGQLRRHIERRSQSAASRGMEEALPSDLLESSSPIPNDLRTESRVAGLVMATRTDASARTEFVEISLGSDDGLRNGETLQVYRTRGEDQLSVGRIEIAYLTPQRAVGRVISRNGGMTVERGDEVIRDSPAPTTEAITSEAAEASPPKELTLQIDADGTAHHDGKSLTIPQLQTLVQKEQASLLILRVDRSASSQAVSDIIEAAKSAGIAEMKFAMRAVDPAGEAQPADVIEPERSLESKELKLNIDDDDHVHHEGKQLTLRELAILLKEHQPFEVKINVDRHTSTQGARDVVDVLKDAGIRKVRFAPPDE